MGAHRDRNSKSHMEYAELHAHSYYSFLNGTSGPEELAQQAASLGLTALALTDQDGLYGVIPFYQKCQALELQPIIGAQITINRDDQIVLLCHNLLGYHHLCRLITRGRLNCPKGESSASLEDLGELADGLICLVGGKAGKLVRLLQEKREKEASSTLHQYREIFGSENIYIELTHNLDRGDTSYCQKLYHLACKHGLRCVATNGVHYARKEQGRLHDVLLCIKHRVTLDQSDRVRPKNHQRYLKSAQEMARLFWDIPQALCHTRAIAERCYITLDFSHHRFPAFPVPQGHTSDSYLTTLCKERLQKKYNPVTSKVKRRLEEELQLIGRLGLSGYFLAVWDIVSFAKARGIPVQGRGSAANSLVAYLLNITPVDAIKHNLFFGRFLNEEQTTIPDIDLDFAASRNSGLADREDVIQYVYRRYGEENVAIAASFITFGARGAIREVGKVFEIPDDALDRMARLVEGNSAAAAFEKLDELGEFGKYLSAPMWEHFTQQVKQIIGLPRHLSMHPGGMVIASHPIPDLVPLEPARMAGRRVCQWDKDMIEAAGLIKVDLLGLGMLAVVREATLWIQAAYGISIKPDEIPPDDPNVYGMLGDADAIGVFELESRIQSQTLPRTKPRNLSELAIQVAIIRPGPVQGNMVKPYIHRKQGKESISYPHPRLEPILKETLGVILFQEQVLQVAVAIAGYTPGEAENLRRDLGKKRSEKAINPLKDNFVAGAVQNGVSSGDAESIFECIKGFASYGFCKSHALAFAHLAYQSAWLRHYYPVAFLTALLNNQPMGFYPPKVLIQDAKRHGIKILPIDVNRSGARCAIEADARGGKAIRLRLVCIKGVSLQKARVIERVRSDGPFASLRDFVQRTQLELRLIERLIQVGAFDCFGRSRRELLWQLWILDRWREENLLVEPKLTPPKLPPLESWDRFEGEYHTQGFSPHCHPMQLIRQKLNARHIYRSDKLEVYRDGIPVRVAGLVICIQRPPTARGFAFLTLEDESGLINVIIPPDVYETYRSVVKLSPFVCVKGKLQRQDNVLSIRAESFERLPGE